MRSSISLCYHGINFEIIRRSGRSSIMSLYYISYSTVNAKPKETTIDPAEIEMFSIDAQDWWDPEKGPVRALHTLNKLRVPYFVEVIRGNNGIEPLKNKTILDVGCGGGLLSEALASFGATVTGIDASRDLIRVAAHHCNENKDLKLKPTYHCITVEEHATEFKNYYDAIVASEIIEHVNNKELFVKSCLETLKPGGKICFTAPSKTRLSKFVNIWFAENVINNPPKGTHQYDKFISLQELQTLLQANKCQVQETRGFKLNMITNKWSWSSTKSLFFAMHAVKLN